MSDGYTTLADEILSVLVESHFDKDNKEFVPAKSLDHITTRDTIDEELSRAVTDDDAIRHTLEFQSLVTYIHERATTLFLIAISVGFEHSVLYDVMRLFKAHDWCDSDNLPIKPLVPKEKHELSAFGAPWNVAWRIRQFYNGQWTFLAPVFKPATQARSTRDFKRAHILPFTKKHNVFDQGSFGKVYKYTIHQDHLVDPENPVSTLCLRSNPPTGCLECIC